MFVRFRETGRRLQASLVATRRSDGVVRHEHVAGLGSVPRSPSPADRIAFWTKLHQRLDALSNRVDAAQRGVILAAIHARIPMPTLDDQRAEQLERAREDARFWNTLAEMDTDFIEGNKGILASTQRAIAEREQVAANTTAKAQAAKDRLARVEKGEAVAGVPRPLTRKDVQRITGMTEAQLRHTERIAEIDERGGFELFKAECLRRRERIDVPLARQVLRVLQGRVRR